MPLTQQERRKLKATAHSLHPVIIIGSKGLTQNVVLETDRALEVHELIKVRVNAEDRLARQEITEDLCQQSQAELVQMIGHIAIIYRRRLDNDKTH